MFVGDHSQWLPPPPEDPPPPPRRLSVRQERWLMRVLGLNLILLFVAPIGGATIIQALLAWWTGW